MARRIVCGLVLLIMSGSLRAEAQTVITGRVVGADGEVMPAAHVEVYPFYTGRHPVQVIAAPEGRYRVAVEAVGLVRLQFVGPLHQAHAVVVLAEGDPIALDVRLQRAWMDADQSFTRVVTEHTSFAYDDGASLEAQPDGSYTATVDAPGDTLVYDLPGARSQTYMGWAFDAITADRFIYTRNGYYAVVASPGAQVQVTLTPRRLGTEQPPEPLTTFGPENARTEVIWAFHQQLQRSRDYVLRSGIRVGWQGASEAEDRDRQNMLRQEVRTLEIDIEREADPFRRDVLLMLYLSRTSGLPFWQRGIYRSGFAGQSAARVAPSPAYLQRALDVIPPTSMGWAVYPALLQVLVEQTNASEEAVAYVEAVVAAHPVEAVRRLALLNLLDGVFARRGLSEEVVAYLEQYTQAFGEGEELGAMRRDRRVRVEVGRKAPAFGGMPWERRTAVSSDSLMGKVVLLDFYASWCEACDDDEAQLRQAHTAYHSDGFEIVRVRLDEGTPPDAAAEVEPWHVYPGEDGFKSRIAMAYEVLTLPRRVLIGHDGMIQAVGDGLFGDRLAATLRQVFAQ